MLFEFCPNWEVCGKKNLERTRHIHSAKMVTLSLSPECTAWGGTFYFVPNEYTIQSNLCCLHPSQKLVNEAQAPFVLWWWHGHQFGARHGPSEQVRHDACCPQQRLRSKRGQAPRGEPLSLLSHHSSWQEVALSVNTGALQSQGDQLLLQTCHSTTTWRTQKEQRFFEHPEKSMAASREKGESTMPRERHWS